MKYRGAKESPGGTFQVDRTSSWEEEMEEGMLPKQISQ